MLLKQLCWCTLRQRTNDLLTLRVHIKYNSFSSVILLQKKVAYLFFFFLQTLYTALFIHRFSGADLAKNCWMFILSDGLQNPSSVLTVYGVPFVFKILCRRCLLFSPCFVFVLLYHHTRTEPKSSSISLQSFCQIYLKRDKNIRYRKITFSSVQSDQKSTFLLAICRQRQGFLFDFRVLVDFGWCHW